MGHPKIIKQTKYSRIWPRRKERETRKSETRKCYIISITEQVKMQCIILFIYKILKRLVLFWENKLPTQKGSKGRNWKRRLYNPWRGKQAFYYGKRLSLGCNRRLCVFRRIRWRSLLRERLRDDTSLRKDWNSKRFVFRLKPQNGLSQ